MTYDSNDFNHSCSGVYEFIGVQDSLLGELTVKHRLDEMKVLRATEHLYMIYKCSRCGDVKIRMNQEFQSYIKHKENQIRTANAFSVSHK